MKMFTKNAASDGQRSNLGIGVVEIKLFHKKTFCPDQLNLPDQPDQLSWTGLDIKKIYPEHNLQDMQKIVHNNNLQKIVQKNNLL